MKEILHVGALRQGRFIELSTGQAPSLQPEMGGSSGSAEPLRSPVPQAASEGVNAASRPCLLPQVRFWSSPSVVPVSGDGCWPQSSPAGPGGESIWSGCGSIWSAATRTAPAPSIPSATRSLGSFKAESVCFLEERVQHPPRGGQNALLPETAELTNC